MDPILERYQALEEKVRGYSPNADFDRLSAAFRIKGTLVQNNVKAFFCFSALQDFGCEFFFIYIFII